ncbi:MAG: Type 1 glutamine amidotransferase-like domain-containing protein [Marivita sp.]|uniref:Type 1 glutamine amidotransferase-like domain-containing protein n=1 Tax=Marivita sp. TaxID=2003365 RepID=UPI001B148816|nr:Type 1 glutamine amidotransferase-like domain-containing protein [Marivita sp.]MBO6884093.1 Type 1 glutamine amidotransferase-like domain-containing protein [Marivita sp.]
MEDTTMNAINITAIGGGGFTHDTYPALDEFCLKQASKADVRLGFIGAASNDDPVKIDRFHARFDGLTARHVHLPMALDTQTLENHLNVLDMVYIGGGDTEAMVDLWRRNGWDRVLSEAARRGLAIAGVSAGAVCWFDRFLFHSGSGPMRPLQGLGLIKGGACPHYSTETDRHAALHDAVSRGTMPNTIAMDDGVAVVFDASGPVATYSAEPEASAFHVRRTDAGRVTETRLSF